MIPIVNKIGNLDQLVDFEIGVGKCIQRAQSRSFSTVLGLVNIIHGQKIKVVPGFKKQNENIHTYIAFI